MKLILNNTDKIISVNGNPARIWEGETESGIKVMCFITKVVVSQNEPRIEEFENELKKQNKPSSEAESIPMRLIF